MLLIKPLTHMEKILINPVRCLLGQARLGEVLRFLAAGVVNTIVGYIIYLVFLHWFRYEVAYAISYIAGIVVSYFINAVYVFRQPVRWSSALHYPLVYLLQFLLGLVLLKLLVDLMHLPEQLAPILVAVLTVPVTFLMSRVIIRKS